MLSYMHTQSYSVIEDPVLSKKKKTWNRIAASLTTNVSTSIFNKIKSE